MTRTDTSAELSRAVSPHSNRLAQEKSPYLLQHAHNPVDWYPWGEEAFARARRENKPIFLSIGYSTCHWCHVMAHESFEDDETAAIMNTEFINIKVDREERPDVDRVYMTFVQATTGGGGWPMSVWLTPDLNPFVGGTYFPPTDRYGQPAFRKVLERIADAWKRDRDKIVDQSSKIMEALRQSQTAQSDASAEMDEGILAAAYEQFERSFDEKEGGFGNAPKFPRPVALNFLARFWARDPKSEKGRRARQMVLVTLRKMAAGGIHDHVGGGFHRYSVDRYWHVPHFEKMLYDQAQLAMAYLDALQIINDVHLGPPERDEDPNARLRIEFEATVHDILDYVLRELTSKEGGFFSAEDADSPVRMAAGSELRDDQSAHPDTEASSETQRMPLQKTAEGAFYVWTEKEIDEALGPSADLFKFHYGVQSHGNAPEGSDPHDEFRGKNILIERHTISETAARFKKSEKDVVQSLTRSRQELLAIRSKRPRPHLDDKIIAGWNGLMISAYARGAQILDEPRYLELAANAAEFLRSNLYQKSDKLLFRTYRDGRSDIEAFADDYAFAIQGFLDLYEASFNIQWLKLAGELQQTQDRLFFDQNKGGYFTTAGGDKNTLLRMKDDNDSAEPAASSVAALNLLRISEFQGGEQMRERAERTIRAFGPTLSHFPSAMPQMLVAFNFLLSKRRQIVIAGKIDSQDTKALLKEVHRHFVPNKTLIVADGGEGQKYFAEKKEAIRDMSTVYGKAAAYVCENFTCTAPVTDPKQLAELLRLSGRPTL